MNILISISFACLFLSVGMLCLKFLIPNFGIFGISGIILLTISSIITSTVAPYGIVAFVTEASLVSSILTVLWRYIKKNSIL